MSVRSKIKRSTLSDANEKRDWRIYAAFANLNTDGFNSLLGITQFIEIPESIVGAASAVASCDIRVSFDTTMETETFDRNINFTILTGDTTDFITMVGSQDFGVEPRSGEINVTFSKDILEELLPYVGQEVHFSIAGSVPGNTNGTATMMIDNVSFVIEENVLSTSEEVLAKELTIAPNPNQGNFVLSYAGQKELKELILQDITGKLVQKIDLSDFDGRKQISLFKPEAGVYFARIFTEKGTIINKRILIE